MIQVHEIGLHVQFIGEILDVKADAEVLGGSGAPELDKVRPFALYPGDWGYYGVGELLAHAFVVGKKKNDAGA